MIDNDDAAATISLRVVPLRITALKPNPSNPRQHSRRQIQQIAKSIAAFGFNVPILVDSDLNIIAGHGRALAARHLGMSAVPTVSLDHLSAQQIRAFTIADNRLTETSTWDDKLLAEQLKQLSIEDLDFSLDVTGFDMGEIDLRIDGLDAAPGEEPNRDEPPEITGPPVSKLGDLWLLGQHRLLCGSALDPSAFRTLMDGDRAAMVFTDPPYNVPIDGHVSGLGAIRHREFEMASGEMDASEFTDFLTRSFDLLARNSVDGSIHFICMDWRHCIEILSAGQEVFTTLKNICVWVKHNAGMGSFYRSQHELVFVFKIGKSAHRNNIELGRHGRNRSNVWPYSGANSFGRSNDDEPKFKLHPTVKPIQLVADAILDCTSRRDIVLDSFIGSGTTILAAERTGRLCYGLEIDPLYVDAAIRRWQAHTGSCAKCALTDKRFDSQQEDAG